METMPLSEVLALLSGDFRIPVSQILTEMEGRTCYNAARLGGDTLPTCDEHILRIAEDMETNGWNGPPVCVIDGRLRNGHHRTMAAWLLGLDSIPVTESWGESDRDW